VCKRSIGAALCPGTGDWKEGKHRLPVTKANCVRVGNLRMEPMSLRAAQNAEIGEENRIGVLFINFCMLAISFGYELIVQKAASRTNIAYNTVNNTTVPTITTLDQIFYLCCKIFCFLYCRSHDEWYVNLYIRFILFVNIQLLLLKL